MAGPSKQKSANPKLLSGGNPQIPNGYGDEPVQDYIAGMPRHAGLEATMSAVDWLQLSRALFPVCARL